nr:hypothetical protein [Rhizoctonia sp.]
MQNILANLFEIFNIIKNWLFIIIAYIKDAYAKLMLFVLTTLINFYCYMPYYFSLRKYSIDSRDIKNSRVKGPRTPDAPDLTEYQKEVIFGTMLGDATAEKSQLNGNTRLRFYMSNVNQDLIFHLYSIFKPFVRTAPKEVTRKQSKLTGKIHTDIRFSTLKYPMFNWLIDDFYVKDLHNNIKIVPLNAYEKLTAVGLAFLIMDDGSFNITKGHLVICTDSFSKEDVLRLIHILNSKFGLSCGLINHGITKGGNIAYRIRINKSSMPSLINLVKPHIIPSMLYKLGL